MLPKCPHCGYYYLHWGVSNSGRPGPVGDDALHDRHPFVTRAGGCSGSHPLQQRHAAPPGGQSNTPLGVNVSADKPAQTVALAQGKRNSVYVGQQFTLEHS